MKKETIDTSIIQRKNTLWMNLTLDMRGYERVFTDSGRRLELTFVVFETVVSEGKRYFLVRRYHFTLKRGVIDRVKLYRGVIIPEKEEENYAILYKNNFFDLTASATESPVD